MSTSPTEVLVFTRPTSVVASLKKVIKSKGAQPAIKQFCSSTNSIKRARGSGGPVDQRRSHFMYGNLHGMGCLEVQQGPMTEVLARAYVTDFQSGWFSALTENKPAGCMRMYFDYDIEMPTFPTESFWCDLESIEKRELQRFFPGRSRDDAIFTSTVATSGGVVDVANDSGAVTYKAGIHVYYPHLFVTVEMALRIASAVLSAAKQTWPEADGVWEKRVDRAVYGETRGLRWVWMFKSKPCVSCAGASAAVSRKRGSASSAPWCESCSGVGQVADTSASMYSPLYRVDGKGCREAILPACRSKPTVELMLECSIRAVYSAEPTAGFEIYPGAEPLPVLKPRRGTDVVAVSCSGDSQFQKSAKTADLLPRDSPKIKMLQSVIRRINGLYNAVEIDKVLKYNSRNKHPYYKVFVTGKGSGYCLNMAKDHRTARVYFVLMRSGLVQKCWCQCDTVRESGVRCKEYESSKYSLFPDEAATLFETPSSPYGLSSSDALSSMAMHPSTSSILSSFASARASLTPGTDDAAAFTDATCASLFVGEFKTRVPEFAERFQYDKPGSITSAVKAMRRFTSKAPVTSRP